MTIDRRARMRGAGVLIAAVLAAVSLLPRVEVPVERSPRSYRCAAVGRDDGSVAVTVAADAGGA